jgi:XapX domain-containing protein
MSQIFLSLLAGFLVGIIFSAIRLPVPAPPVLTGVLGIVGIYLGSVTYHWVLQRFFESPTP